jgi:hypothetical protein
MTYLNKKNHFQYNLTDFPEFQKENKSSIINEAHPKCKAPTQKEEKDLLRYTEWRQSFYDQGYSDSDLTKMIHEKRLENQLTDIEKTIPFFYINNMLDVHVLRQLYNETNGQKIYVNHKKK